MWAPIKRLPDYISISTQFKLRRGLVLLYRLCLFNTQRSFSMTRNDNYIIKNHFNVTKCFIMNAVSQPRQLVYIDAVFKNAYYNGAVRIYKHL